MFLVVEMQNNINNLSHIETVHETQAEAEQKFHTILSAAAVSEVPVHTALLIDGNGYVIKTEGYTHNEEETNES